jgi:hypothetical protein
MVVGGVADQRVNDYSFSKGGKVTHQIHSPGRTGKSSPTSPIYFLPARVSMVCGRSQADQLSCILVRFSFLPAQKTGGHCGQGEQELQWFERLSFPPCAKAAMLSALGKAI